MLDKLLRIFLVITSRIWNNTMDHGSTISNASLFCDRLLACMKVCLCIKPHCSSNCQWWWICVIFPKEDCIRWDSSSCCCYEQLGKCFDIVFHQGREEKEITVEMYWLSSLVPVSSRCFIDATASFPTISLVIMLLSSE